MLIFPEVVLMPEYIGDQKLLKPEGVSPKVLTIIWSPMYEGINTTEGKINFQLQGKQNRVIVVKIFPRD